jgi:hypothetical protein
MADSFEQAYLPGDQGRELSASLSRGISSILEFKFRFGRKEVKGEIDLGSNGEDNTHDKSSGVAGCEDPPPIVCAKLVIGPLFGRGLPRPAPPIGTPPKAHVAPLFAKTVDKYQHNTLFPWFTKILKRSVPIFPLGGILFDTFLFCICC